MTRAELDIAIEEFKPRARDRHWHDADKARYQCSEATRQFVAFLRERTEARSHSAPAHYLLDGYPHSPRAVHDGHSVVLVELDDGEVTVDWTATQYEIMDPWPVVRAWENGPP